MYFGVTEVAGVVEDDRLGRSPFLAEEQQRKPEFLYSIFLSLCLKHEFDPSTNRYTPSIMIFVFFKKKKCSNHKEKH